ncbi:MAG: Hpt domain-containing protein [Xanthomonadales bacterium]|nr:Hpt domain-containing protein [Xanthomonadales bacterium]
MLLEGSNVSTVLTWVRPDLDKHLNQIRIQVEHIANSANTGEAVENTAEHLLQLKYTFETLMLQGATIVIEEMIMVCDELRDFNVRDRQKAYGAMMDAIVVVPSYLDRLQAGHHDLPILLLPIVNELRAAYNANIVSEATLFAPSLDIPLPELETSPGEHEPAFDEPFAEFALRMRRQWESALLRWLQHQQDIELLSPLLSVCETLHHRLERMDLRRLWWIAAKVIGGLLDGVTDNDMHLRRLFARLHLNLKTLSEGGEEATELESANALSQALLFHIAQAKPGSESVDQLRERFQLQELVPDRDVLIRARGAVTGRNRELYVSLGAAVRDEFSLVKDALDLELRTGEIRPDSREQSHEALLRLTDTLKMMGLGDSSRSIEKLIPAFGVDEDPDSDPDSEQNSSKSILMELAGELIRVESVLEEQIATLGEPLLEDQETSYIDLPRHEIRRIRTHLLGETVTSLHHVQDGVRNHFKGDPDADFSTPMEQIAGAMELIGESETASLALKLRNALGNLLRHASSESAVEPGKLETVTDAVAAFELYLAGCRDHQDNRGRFFEILKERLERLPVGEMEVVKPAKAPPTPEQTGAKDSRKPDDESTLQALTIDPELLDVFLEEYETVTSMLAERIPQWVTHQENTELLAEIRRGFHTLKGSGRMVGANELGDFAWHIEELLNHLLEGSIESIKDVVTVLRLSEAALPAMKQRLQQQSSELNSAAIEALASQADNIAAGNEPDWTALGETSPPSFAALLSGDVSTMPITGQAPAGTTDKPAKPTLKELIRKELREKLAVLAGLMERISRDRHTTASDDEVIAIHTIVGTTAQEPLGRESDIAKTLEGFLEAQRQSGKAFSDNAMWTVATSLAHFEACLAVHEEDPEAELTTDEESQIKQLIALTVEYEVPQPAQEEPEPEVEASESEPAAETTEASEEHSEPEPEVEASESEPVAETTEANEEHSEPEQEEDQEDLPAETVLEQVDSEILGIFLEEATEILERCDSLLNSWRDDLPDLEVVQNLQREIHTFKGGARMAGVNALGNLSHSMETLLERIAGQLLPPTVSAIEVLEQGCDRLNVWTQQASQGEIPQAGDALKLFNQQVEALTALPSQPEAKTEAQAKSDTEPEKLQEIPDVAVPASEPEVSEEPTAETASSQQIRVNADLLDSLVNSAGEISIFRSHLEQQVGQIRDNLKEFDVTVSRIREQFRKLEIETETQIGSGYQQEATDGAEEFDPLEMDRFSGMQHLSRSLTESVSDLLNLQELLETSARKSEALLVQQSRVSKDLQEGLMQTRMVHFGTIAPRLRRIIRTSAKETKKRARLQLRMTGGGDQLDRNVLERIVAPLEHLLRNSIAHGIEYPATRLELKKPEEGQLSITVAAEATEFVVRVEDDGAGIDLAAIQKRAIEKGLMEKDEEWSPQQLQQLILNSGFSTSKTVTALSGRGVGMDVVNNEIKQIGGSIEIDSEEGKGCTFTIRIPFTLAVMQAIGVMAGEHPYMIPVVSVAGVARMLPEDYEELLVHDKPAYEFAGESYPILDLEPLLGEPTTPLGDDTISILMIKSGEQRAAFRVSKLLGHKEIVVKPVGPQINSVPGILGGTITGDGQVIIIIDAGPLIRQAKLTGARPAPPIENIDIRPKRTLALVADDSITMRKVTTRVLEAYDIEVITARDGVEATEQMQDCVPDLLLLDIEMPRMDGYQVAEHVRADSRLRNVPIIMITSRAGKKHRDRGKQAGANAYLSKPYKESELIAEVRKLLRKEME